jgi:hypothetical protein
MRAIAALIPFSHVAFEENADDDILTIGTGIQLQNF